MTHLPPHSKEKGFTPEDDQGEGMSGIAEGCDDTLWAVSIAGPDDLIPVATYDDACRVANSFNEWWRQYIASRGGLHKFDPHMWAKPVIYPWAPENHAEGVANPSEDYVAFVKESS